MFLHKISSFGRFLCRIVGSWIPRVHRHQTRGTHVPALLCCQPCVELVILLLLLSLYNVLVPQQLNIYGFHKTRHEEHYVEVEFKHPHFRREQRHLLGLIRRKSHSSTSPKQQRDDNVR